MTDALPEGVRDRAELEVAYELIKNNRFADPDFRDGALAGYEWILGRTAAPISGRAGEITVREIRREEELADDAIYRRRGAAELRQDWAVGLQHALMWARGKAKTAPGGF